MDHNKRMSIKNCASYQQTVFVYFTMTLFCFVSCEFPFRNISLPFETRVEDLVKRLTLDELVQQMSRGGGGGDGGPTSPIKRLGIGPYWWGAVCLHGDVLGSATSFPQSIGMAAAFSPELIRSVAEASSIEVRALNNDFVKRKIYAHRTGLNCLNPVVNIMRHPLWGRNQETYGEDPYLSGIYGAKFAQGLKGNHSRYFRATAVCKHLDAYGGPEDIPESRLSFNAKVSERDLHMTFLPQFKACIDGGALGVMCSYNSVNGVPSCVNKKLLTDVLRTSWNFKGFVISDAGALEFIILDHKYILDVEETAVACVNAGLNLEMHAYQYPRGVYDWLKDAVNHGKLAQKTLVERVKPLFYTRMRLGEFDPPSMNPYLNLNLSVVQSLPHRELSVLAAMQSFVLLKNDGFLPMKSAVETVAIVGPFSDNAEQQMGNYAPKIDPRYMTTVKSGLSPLGRKSLVASGCDNTRCLKYNAVVVKKAVRTADVTFVCLGTGQAIETENFDRKDMLLPGYQAKLLQDAVNNTRGRIVVLLFSAGPLDIHKHLALQPAVSAVIHCFFPAQATGVALYNVITNKYPEANPAGRLPFTWYLSDEQECFRVDYLISLCAFASDGKFNTATRVPAMTDYSMWNKTYRYFQGTPLYPFGYGLSYTQFHFSDLHLTPTKVKAGQNVTASFKISNIGPVAGGEVFQIYISWLNSTVPTPIYQLVNFNRTMLDKGQTRSYSAVITSEVMAVWLDKKGFVVEPGEMAVYVGGQLPNQNSTVPSNILKAAFTVYGCHN